MNAIAPALIETDMATSNPNASPNLIPMGHFGSVDDIASVAVMLATNDYMTSSAKVLADEIDLLRHVLALHDECRRPKCGWVRHQIGGRHRIRRCDAGDE